jgi:hypothetical protein
MNATSTEALERVKVREVAGVFRSLREFDAATEALLRAGFDRADIDVMADVEEIIRKLGPAGTAATELADVPAATRRPLIRSEDVVLVVACASGIAAFLLAAALALIVVARGGSYLEAALAALVPCAVTIGIGAFLVHRLTERRRTSEMRALAAAGGIVLWVRVRSPMDEQKASALLAQNGALAVRTHDIEIEKRLQDLPLSSLRPDPWLGDHRLGDVER